MRTMLILIEDASIRNALARMVEREGMYVIAADPRRGDHLLGDVSFDVVLCDWFLSRSTAEATLEALKAEHYIGRVVVMAGNTDDDHLRRACARNGFRLLPKPFNLVALRRLLNESSDDRSHALRAGPVPSAAPVSSVVRALPFGRESMLVPEQADNDDGEAPISVAS